MTTKLAHDNSETSTLSNSDWLSTSLTSSTLHNCPSFSSLCCQPCSQRFHTNHIRCRSTSSPSRPKNCEKKNTSDRHHIDKKAAAEISCSAARASIRTRYAELPRALVTMFAVQTSGMHCACVHTKCRHALRMRSHELESDAWFCCKSPPPPHTHTHTQTQEQLTPTDVHAGKHAHAPAHTKKQIHTYTHTHTHTNTHLHKDTPTNVCSFFRVYN